MQRNENIGLGYGLNSSTLLLKDIGRVGYSPHSQH